MHRGLLVASVVASLGASQASLARASSSGASTAHRERRPVYRTEVVGCVLDSHGNGVAGVSVIATPVETVRPGAPVITDRHGRFRITGIKPGMYWFIGIHGDHPIGITPALPVEDRLEVSITLDLAVISA